MPTFPVSKGGKNKTRTQAPLSNLQHKRQGPRRCLRSEPPRRASLLEDRRETKHGGWMCESKAARFTQRVAAYPVKVEGRQSNEEARGG